MAFTSTMTSSTIINFPRKRASSIELPDATAWLEYLELGMNTVHNGNTVHYEVQATYRPAYCDDTEINWKTSHPFDAYRRFRKQLLRRLQPGHLCPAECKWLHSVVKNHFPKSRLFAANSLRTTEARQQSLIRLLRTLQASLVNRGNQGCNVLVRNVCYDFTTFILGENTKMPDIMMAMALSRCSSDQSTRNSSASFRSNCSDCEDCEDISPCENDGRTSGRGYCKSESGQ